VGEGGLFWGHGLSLDIFWRLFGVFERRTIFFVIFCTFSQNSITLGGVVVVLWSSGGGCYARSRGVHKSYAMHKSTTVHVTDPLGPPVLPVITKPGRCTYIPMISPAEFIPKNFSWLCSPESNDKKESVLTEEDLEITSWSSPVQLFKPKKSVSTYLHRMCPYTHYP
jgi:hypothetical protein